MTKRSPLMAITIIQTLVVFALGIVGNKIAELAQIEPIVLVVVTCVLLASSIIFQLLWVKAAPNPPIERWKGGVSRRFIPRTMINIFPVGMLLGLIASSLLSLLYYYCAQIGFLILYVAEVGVLGGVIIGTLLALFVDAYLAGALTFGYGLSHGIGMLVMHPSPDVVRVVLGTVLIWMLGVIFPLYASELRKFGEFLTKERF